MLSLILIGIGTGNPDHLTVQAIKAMRSADLIVIPRKGAGKADLAELRRAIVAEHAPETPVAEFDLPVRNAATADYLTRVNDWHEAIAAVWAATINAHPGPRNHVALLVWGDPSLYDSTLRIAARLTPAPVVRVIPGITALQGLTAAHAMPLNDLGAPVTITTGRRLRDEGWPPGCTRLAVMLDGECSFAALDPLGVTIWWGAYVGMAEQSLLAGPLADVTQTIITRRASLRAAHGWIMDIYLLSRETPPGD